MFGGFFKSVVKSADEVLFSGVKVRNFWEFENILDFMEIDVFISSEEIFETKALI
jgi:hypothetical protein